MTTPLKPSAEGKLNSSSPNPLLNSSKLSLTSDTRLDVLLNESFKTPSSPFVENTENASPQKSRSTKTSPSKRLRGGSPVKIQQSPLKQGSTLCPKKQRLSLSPHKKAVSAPSESLLTIEGQAANAEREGLKNAFAILEDEVEDMDEDGAHYDIQVTHHGSVRENDTMMTALDGSEDTDGFPGMDDTAFSAFSAVPNAGMTLFARIGEASPGKQLIREAEAQMASHQFDECVSSISLAATKPIALS